MWRILMQIDTFLLKFTKIHAPDPYYSMNPSDINGLMCFSTCMVHMVSSICTWYTGTLCRGATFWSYTQPRGSWKYAKCATKRTVFYGVEAEWGQYQWPSVVKCYWGTCSLAYAHVRWRYNMDILRILITHTLMCAICIWRIHVQTKCLRCL